MKRFATALISGLVFVESALACSPPRDELDRIPQEMAFVVGHQKVRDELRAHGATTVRSISAETGYYWLLADRGCSLEIKAVYAPPVRPGECPSLTDVDVTSTICLP